MHTKYCFNVLFVTMLLSADHADISQALQKLTEPTSVHMPRLSTMSNMVHSARKRMHKHRRIEESPISNEVLNSILLVSGYLLLKHTLLLTTQNSVFINNGQLICCPKIRIILAEMFPFDSSSLLGICPMHLGMAR